MELVLDSLSSCADSFSLARYDGLNAIAQNSLHFVQNGLTLLYNSIKHILTINNYLYILLLLSIVILIIHFLP